MKLKEGFVVRSVAGRIVALPTGDELNLNLMITLNETGKFLWDMLAVGTTRDQLVSALLREYEVDTERAGESVDRFVEKLKENGFLE